MKRLGACHRCGACCCVLAPECAKKYLHFENGVAVCRVYHTDLRGSSCTDFPTEDYMPFLSLLEEVKRSCGYKFVED